ncbi:MAG TPA: MinD/ParA family protein [Phycisphaerae bacterium]|nr:MinD/ParA family protein [Phycisphaerae bacterium]
MSADDQASKLRELMRASRGTRTIAVASGKGGVGKSNVALNLSILLSAAGHRVALVDADLGLANLDVLADVMVRANLSHVINGNRSLEEIVVDLPSGVQLVPGASGLARLASLSEFQRGKLLGELSALEADNDVIVVDCSAGIGPDMMGFACGSDHAIVVTTPEPTAVTDAYAVIKAMTQRRYAGHMSLLVNMVAGRNEARATHQRIATVARQFIGARVFDAGYVLADPRVPEAVRKRQPFVLAFPRCPASRCLAALATKLRSGSAMVQAKGGFFRRVANWFA